MDGVLVLVLVDKHKTKRNTRKHKLMGAWFKMVFETFWRNIYRERIYQSLILVALLDELGGMQ